MNLARCMAALYLIEILHQTTTSSRARARLLCCILLKFYIKPQQPFTRSRYSKLYLIEILHQTTTCGKCEDCLRRLYLIEILHQTTTPALASMPLCRCILLKFYIKPQLRLERELAYCVVSYRNSTSNHNEGEPLNTQRKLYLIEILHQTTTLNFIGREFILLYLIEILHQTTTLRLTICLVVGCILSKFYIKPQQDAKRQTAGNGCILSKFYIKPQLLEDYPEEVYVVSYRNSTSNHNGVLELRSAVLLYLIEILHQTTTEGLVWLLRYVLYLIEILHQTTTEMVAYISFILLYLIEILHQTTTIFYKLAQRLLLYLIEILHQTTTFLLEVRRVVPLYLIEILHQTTTNLGLAVAYERCILSKFYIKPQLRLERELARCVVSYRNSTSNHN